jgi:hypothetical protein
MWLQAGEKCGSNVMEKVDARWLEKVASHNNHKNAPHFPKKIKMSISLRKTLLWSVIP